MSEAAAQGGSHSRLALAWRALPDDRLAQRASMGDERAFTAIYRRYHQPLYRFCLAILGNPEDAQDALQNTMVKALRALPGEERQIQLKPWLYRIAHNECVDLLRRRRETRQLDPELPTSASGPVEAAAQRERLGQLIADIAELPERQRGALVMRELGGLGFTEIGGALDTSAAVARQTVYEARLSLRQMATGREMGCEAATKALSDADGRVARRRDIRAHLRACPDCSRFRDELDGRRQNFASIAPLPAAAAAGLLPGILAGSSASSGGLAGAVGGGGASALGASALAKSAATVVVVAIVGVTAADRGGLVQSVPRGGDPRSTPRAEPSSKGVAGRSARQPTAAPKGGIEVSVRAARARAAKAEVGKPHLATAVSEDSKPSPGGTEETASAPPSPGLPSKQGRGRGHAKSLPSAAAHGQQTAAAHKATGRGAGHDHPADPAKPPHPVHPANPGSEKAKAPPPASHGSKPEVPKSSLAPQAAEPPQKPASPDETGKKP